MGIAIGVVPGAGDKMERTSSELILTMGGSARKTLSHSLQGDPLQP